MDTYHRGEHTHIYYEKTGVRWSGNDNYKGILKTAKEKRTNTTTYVVAINPLNIQHVL